MAKVLWSLLLGWIISCCLALGASSHTHSVQLTPDWQKWFFDKYHPITHNRCCSGQDFDFVNEDIREDKIWICSLRTGGNCEDPKSPGWLEVPPENILTDANKWGQPIAWYRYSGPQIFVYCYIPGPRT